MENITTYKEYQDLYKDDLVKAVRKLLQRIEEKGDYELADSREHHSLIDYFNRFALHKKITKSQFTTWK